MNREEFQILTDDRIQAIIAENKGKDPIKFSLAFSNNEFPTALVSQQLKYLQKARKKLPSWHTANCLLPALAYEQCSSEQSAALKVYEGKRGLDLCSGLGVDSYYLSKGFEEFIALEKNPVLAAVQDLNLTRLKNKKVEVLNLGAKEYLTAYTGPPFDLIYLDPDRRDEQGKRYAELGKSSPNIFEIWPLLAQHGKRILIKASPLIDIQEVIRLFPELIIVSVVSVDNECREILIECQPGVESPQVKLKLHILRDKQRYQFESPYPPNNPKSPPIPNNPAWLYEADVASYKARCMPFLVGQQNLPPQLSWNHPAGFAFSQDEIQPVFPSKVFKILAEWPYKPKLIRKNLISQNIRHIQISRRHFPFSVTQIRNALKLKDGGKYQLICTLVGEEKKAYLCERIRP